MVPQQRLSPNEIAAIIQAALRPLDEKVDDLIANRVTRIDMEKMRSEITTGYVSRDVYEARQSVLVDRNVQLDVGLREMRRDYDEYKKDIDKRFDKQQDAQLSTQDRTWMRWTQVASGIAVAVAVADLIFQHLKFY